MQPNGNEERLDLSEPIKKIPKRNLRFGILHVTQYVDQTVARSTMTFLGHFATQVLQPVHLE